MNHTGKEFRSSEDISPLQFFYSRATPNAIQDNEDVRNFFNFIGSMFSSNVHTINKAFLYSMSQIKKLCRASREPLFSSHFGTLDNLKAPMFVQGLKLISNFDMSLSEPGFNLVKFRQKHKNNEMFNPGMLKKLSYHNRHTSLLAQKGMRLILVHMMSTSIFSQKTTTIILPRKEGMITFFNYLLMLFRTKSRKLHTGFSTETSKQLKR
jgi:hypothetical protein